MRYWDKVKVTSWFCEGNEFFIVDYMRWQQPNKNYDYVEVPYDMKESDWYLIPLSEKQKKYKLYDPILKIEVRWPDEWWFPESNLEIIK